MYCECPLRRRITVPKAAITNWQGLTLGSSSQPGCQYKLVMDARKMPNSKAIEVFVC